MSSWCGHQDDGWYFDVYDPAWRNVHSRVHSRNVYMSLSLVQTTLYEYDLVQQHVETWWWTDQCEGNVRTVWRKSRTTFTTSLWVVWASRARLVCEKYCGLCESRAWTAITATVSREREHDFWLSGSSWHRLQRVRYVTWCWKFL